MYVSFDTISSLCNTVVACSLMGKQRVWFHPMVWLVTYTKQRSTDLQIPGSVLWQQIHFYSTEQDQAKMLGQILETGEPVLGLCRNNGPTSTAGPHQSSQVSEQVGLYDFHIPIAR